MTISDEEPPSSPGPGAPVRSGGSRPWPKVHPFRRLGPVVLVVAALIGAGTAATLHEEGGAGSGQANAGSSSSGGGGEGLSPGARAQLPVTYAEAEAAGALRHYRWSQQCDPQTGRLKIPIIYSPPCVALQRGPNGGATAPGVTASTVKVVYYEPEASDITAAIEGATSPPAVTLATAEHFVDLLNAVLPLHGRRVLLVPYQGTGTSTDSVAARADAVVVGQQIHAFASIGAPEQTPSYQDELAREHVLCLGCGISVAYSDFTQDAPYLWGSLQTPDTELTESFDFAVHDLIGHDAIYAGEKAFRHHKRVLALVHYDQNPPVFSSVSKLLTTEFSHTNFRLKLQESYLLDLTQLPDEAATIAAHLKRDGITTVIFAGDPIMPIYLTKAAAAIDYYPEWVVTGTVLTDTSTLARLYNQREWRHAFGISSLSVGVPLADGDAQRLYRWYYGTEPPADKTASIILPPLETLFEGIELAGGDLNAYTFRAGLFASPPVGGGPATPAVGYGSHGAAPTPSYTYPEDYSIIWYDAEARGADEEGTVGKGLYKRIDGGRRFTLRHQPPASAPLFIEQGSVASFTTLPPSDVPHRYPPWPASPAARTARTAR